MIRVLFWMFFDDLFPYGHKSRWERFKEKTHCMNCGKDFRDLVSPGAISIPSIKGRMGYCFWCMRIIEASNDTGEYIEPLVKNCTKINKKRLQELLDIDDPGPAEEKEIEKILEMMPKVVHL